LLLFTAACLQLEAQRYDTDIFGDPTYMSRDLRYMAALKKDIFTNLTFTDNNGNEVKFEKKYLDAFFCWWDDVATMKRSYCIWCMNS